MMPELPEVYKVTYLLNEKLVNRRVKAVKVLYSKILENDISKIINKRINKVFRIGKYIIFAFEEDYLIAHMRMEGRFYIGNKLNLKHVHLKLIFDDFILYYQDFRKFGRFKLLSKSTDLYQELKIKKDALDIDEKYLRDTFSKVGRNLKTALLDQRLIAGIGNIYADEICFEAKIHPLSKTSLINDYGKLNNSIKIVLNKFIKTGMDFDGNDEYLSWEFALDTDVHFKKNCKVCNDLIKKIKINGRTTYFCENCQELLK